MHEGLTRGGNIEKRVALRGLLAQAAADQDDDVGGVDAREKFRIGPDAEIAGIAGVVGIEEMRAPEGGGDRKREAFGKARDAGRRRLRPSAAADEHDRALGRP